jgi:septal ring factor EnvC (AmiA/AmiB activator)
LEHPDWVAFALPFYASIPLSVHESFNKMCENREPIDDVNAIREELSALVRLSNQKLDEMKEIQARIDELSTEIARLTQELEDTAGADQA